MTPGERQRLRRERLRLVRTLRALTVVTRFTLATKAGSAFGRYGPEVRAFEGLRAVRPLMQRAGGHDRKLAGSSLPLGVKEIQRMVLAEREPEVVERDRQLGCHVRSAVVDDQLLVDEHVGIVVAANAQRSARRSEREDRMKLAREGLIVGRTLIAERCRVRRAVVDRKENSALHAEVRVSHA